MGNGPNLFPSRALGGLSLAVSTARTHRDEEGMLCIPIFSFTEIKYVFRGYSSHIKI